MRTHRRVVCPTHAVSPVTSGGLAHGRDLQVHQAGCRSPAQRIHAFAFLPPYGDPGFHSRLVSRRLLLVSAFVPGLELSRQFYAELVRPILDARFPGLPHSAALLGRGSEVLGFDDEMSTDHDWKPRVLLFLREEDQARHGEAVGDSLRRGAAAAVSGSSGRSRDPHGAWLLSGAAGRRRLRRDRGARLAHLPGAGAPDVHRGRGLSRRGRSAGRPRPPRLLPARRLALPAGGRLVARPSGSQPGGQGRLGGRRAGIGADRIAARVGPDAALLPDGTAVRAVLEVVRYGVLPAGVRPRAVADPVEGRFRPRPGRNARMR